MIMIRIMYGMLTNFLSGIVKSAVCEPLIYGCMGTKEICNIMMVFVIVESGITPALDMEVSGGGHGRLGKS